MTTEHLKLCFRPELRNAGNRISHRCTQILRSCRSPAPITKCHLPEFNHRDAEPQSCDRLELFGRQRKDFALGEGPRGLSERGSSESINRMNRIWGRGALCGYRWGERPREPARQWPRPTTQVEKRILHNPVDPVSTSVGNRRLRR